jgi:6-phosphogluconate dehydrogenase
MVGGDTDAYNAIEPLLQSLAPPEGYALVGPSGAGHFVKMVHNGIEYGMMQAIAEGFELIAAKEEFGIDLSNLARLWQHGSVVRSWLLELAGNVLEEDPNLDWVEPYVPDSGEGRWTVEEGIDLAVPLPVITLALQMRFRSRQDDSFASRLLAALRNQFGGHTVRRRETP